MIQGKSFLLRSTFSERDFHAALGKLDEDHFQLGCRAWSVIWWSSFINTVGWICLIGAIPLHRPRRPRGLVRWANWLIGRLGRQGLSRHQYLLEQILMAVKALPGGLKEFAIFVGIARGESDITFKAFQSQLEYDAFAGIHLRQIGDVVPFDFKVFVENAARQSVGDIVFVVNGSAFRAEAGTKLLVMTVERRAETVVMAKGFSVRVFEAEVGGQDFTPDVATNFDDAETHGATQ